MVDINGYEIKSAFSGGEPLKAIYSLGEKVWPTVEPEPVDYSKQYFRISPERNIYAEIILNIGSLGDGNVENYDLYYKINYENNWTKITSTETKLKLRENTYVELKGVNDKLCKSSDDYFHIRSANSLYNHIVSGNIMSLLYGDDFIGKNELKSSSSFSRLFKADTNLSDASNLILPATTLTPWCYDSMFWFCSSLNTAPELPATTLEKYCYGSMFYYCSKLNYVKANFTTEPSSTYTDSWLYNVSPTGTFVANPDATWTNSISRGSSTVPAGWTIQK